jgi:hypothetical protein
MHRHGLVRVRHAHLALVHADDDHGCHGGADRAGCHISALHLVLLFDADPKTCAEHLRVGGRGNYSECGATLDAVEHLAAVLLDVIALPTQVRPGLEHGDPAIADPHLDAFHGGDVASCGHSTAARPHEQQRHSGDRRDDANGHRIAP